MFLQCLRKLTDEICLSQGEPGDDGDQGPIGDTVSGHQIIEYG